MATYKVLQDIEAEDTLVGPLTLRQCIYAAIAIGAGYLSFLVISRGAPYLVILFLPFVAAGVFFAFPWSRQQPTEVWALAKVRFALKPRKRIWNQSGVKQLVTITAPKSLNLSRARNLSPTEVQSRLRALADTIDSRGWAVKNIELGYYTQPSLMSNATSDRLIDPTALPQDVPSLDPDASSDIFDTTNNPVAHKFDALMAQSAGAHHEQLVQQMSQPPAGPNAPITQYWHMKTIQPPSHSATQPSVAATSPVGSVPASAPTPAAASVPAPAAGAVSGTSLSPQIPGATYASRPIVAYTPRDSQLDGGQGSAPSMSAPSLSTPAQSAAQSVTDQPNPAILELANNNDLNVATIAREAQARSTGSINEVVVDLH